MFNVMRKTCRNRNSAVNCWLKLPITTIQVATNPHNLQYKSSHLAMY